MAEELFKKLFPQLHLKHSSLELKTYTGERMDTVGEIDVKVCYEQQLHDSETYSSSCKEKWTNIIGSELDLSFSLGLVTSKWYYHSRIIN